MRYRIFYIQRQFIVPPPGPSGYFCSIKAAQKALGIKRVNSDVMLYFNHEQTYHIKRVVTG
jgi:hypothetical protein